MPGRKAQAADGGPVFVDLSGFDVSKGPERRIRVMKASGPKDLSSVSGSLRAGIPVVADLSSFTEGAPAEAVRAIAAEFGAVAYEAAPSVWLVAPADVAVERVRPR